LREGGEGFFAGAGRGFEGNGEGGVGALMDDEAGEWERAERVRDVDVVEPGAVGFAEADDGAAFEADEDGFAVVPRERGKVAGAVAEEREAEIETAGERDLAAFSLGDGLAGGGEDFNVEARLEEDVAGCP
jgi:hypothetical protein